MKTATIKQVKVEPNVGKWNVTSILLDTDEQAYQFTSKPTIYKVGDLVNYEIEEKFGNNKFINIQKVKPANKKPEEKKENKTEVLVEENKEQFNTQQMIARQVALKAAIDLVCADKIELKQLLPTSTKIYQYLNEGK